MKHKHYDLIVQWASDPEAWVVEWSNCGVWCKTKDPCWDADVKYRLIPKRRMMHLNGVEFPAPEKGRYCQLTGLTEGQMRARIAELEAENARLRPNAERYAWLRDWRIRRDGEQFEVRRFEEGLIGRPGKWYYPSGEILDAAIDAERKL